MGTKHTVKDWDNSIPTAEYFIELARVSKNQIIWGANYFELPATRGFIIWDKITPEDLSFSMCEYAWTSFDKSAKIFRKPIQTGNANRIHPTQKPVALYRWLLHNYAKPGDRILDTHGGSRSLAIACHQMGFDHVSCELDKDYHESSVKRFKEQTAQMQIFQP
jgi:site-specific DNA-methyltransferase (adenine-specific)